MQVIPKSPILGQINIATLVHSFGTLEHNFGTLVQSFGNLVYIFDRRAFDSERVDASAKREPHGLV